ncbi:hypothetical protein N865_10920 [Intrasporangium oryzae NRRL B-24470]|uniref:Diacylglycerol O-acyltransferase n=1 Tax=Intrasporangium oryzae NRRL B-24470 TaxID=1386089 RepID=W9G907_9MICO|nr:wax ester/triacylglycerol synthase family O-acyltransferase [Intrasporangium oryzae]EWT01318.1 hypothetical protein N865_10920 [Intrasporangium oryzae NRRL B-24470]
MTRADRLSALDAIFLPMETDTQSLHVGSVLVLEGPAPDPEVFRALVAARVAGVPFLRRRVLRMPLDLGRPIWVDTADFDPADQLRHAALDAPGDEPQLRTLVARIMAPRLPADRPLWELWQVDGLEGGRWAVVAKAHHTMVDGRSGADLVQSLLTRVPDGPPPTATTGAVRRAPSLGALARDLLTWVALLPVRAVRLVARSLRHPREARRRVEQVRFGLSQVLRPDLPPSVLVGPLGAERIWGWAAADLAEVAALARSAHCTLNDVFLAALAGGYRRYLMDRGEALDALTLRAIVPVSRRSPGRPARPGNLASAMFVELPVGLADPEDRLAAVAARTSEQKSRAVADATAAVVRLADHIPAPLLAWGARAYGRSGQGRVNVVASNVAGPSQAQYLAGRRVLAMLPYVPVAEEVRASTAMLTYAGRLTIGVTGDAAALPDVDRLVEAIGRELRDLVARGRAHGAP